MARKSNNQGGGPGGLIKTVLIFLVLAGAVVAFAKANNITTIADTIPWMKSTSQKLEKCIEPDVNFWSCGNPFEFDGGDTKPSTPPKSEENGGNSNGEDSETSVDATLATLNSLRVGKPESVDYNRKEWKHWIGGSCDTTREKVLRNQAVDYKLDAKSCKVASGNWKEPYENLSVTTPKELDIDHVYSLGAAARNGGQKWDAAKKEAFANDTDHLLAVSASANRAKSDKTPEEWMPSNKDFHCEFSTIYVNISAKYDLQISSGDKKALEKGLKTC